MGRACRQPVASAVRTETLVTGPATRAILSRGFTAVQNSAMPSAGDVSPPFGLACHCTGRMEYGNAA